MRAVILAAGEGRRMNGAESGEHKALSKILGISLIERGILAMRDAGVEGVTVVTGHASARIRRALGDGSRLGIPVGYVANSEWPKGNGTSVYAARDLVDGPFIVAMADHWYDPRMVKLLIASASGGGANRLCVDRNVRSPHYPDEATRVHITDQGVIDRTGKDLAGHNGLDCGLFLFNTGVFAALRQCFAAGDYELGSAAHRLALGGRLEMVDIGDLLWEDVDTAPELTAASRKLRRSLPGGDDGLISTHLNRRISVPLSVLAITARFTPNVVSLIALLMAACAGLAFAFGHVIAGGIATQAASIVDGSDGEVARARFMSSRRGGLIDSVFDRVSDGFILGGAGFYLLTGSPERWEFAAVLIAMAVAPMSMILKDRFELATGRKWRSELDDGAARLLLASRDGRLFILFLGGITAQLGAAMAFLAVSGSALLLWRLALAWAQLDDDRRTEAVLEAFPVVVEASPSPEPGGQATGD